MQKVLRTYKKVPKIKKTQNLEKQTVKSNKNEMFIQKIYSTIL